MHSHAHCHACFSVWSNISMCRGAAGNCGFLLGVHPKEPAVCHSSWCSASYSQESGTDRLCSCEFITLTIIYTCTFSQLHLSLVIAVIYSEMFPPSALNLLDFSFRMCPAALGCDQQGSECSNYGNLPPPFPPLLRLLQCSLFIVIVSSPFSGGECTILTWRLVAMAIQGAVAVATGFLWYRLMR